MDHATTVVDAARPLQSIMTDPDVSEKVKHHLHEAMHHMTAAVLSIYLEGAPT